MESTRVYVKVTFVGGPVDGMVKMLAGDHPSETLTLLSVPGVRSGSVHGPFPRLLYRIIRDDQGRPSMDDEGCCRYRYVRPDP